MAAELKLGGTPTDEHGLPWHVLESEELQLATRQQSIIHGALHLDGILMLDGTSQLIIEN